MKFLRFEKDNGEVASGLLESDNTVNIITGDILSKYECTGEKTTLADIKYFHTPLDIPNVIALGLNYLDHAGESKMEIPKAPLIFIKTTNALTAHKNPIILPKEAPGEVDYEAELGVIIGKKAKHIKPEEVSDYILGYTCVNDVSARDCQLRIDKQWARGKSFDTFAPVGPFIETDLDPDDIRVRLLLNGECMQDASTKDMIFNVRDTVSFLSRNMTLLPGTLIMTGTPSGVGFARKPPVFLKPGDKVVVSIEGIGKLENEVTAE